MTTPDPLDGIMMPYAVQFLPVIGSDYLQIPATQRINGSTSTVLFLPPGSYQCQITWRGTTSVSTSLRTGTVWFPGPTVDFSTSGDTRSTPPFQIIVPTTSANGRLMLTPSIAMTQYHIDQGWAASVQIIPTAPPA